MINYIIMRKIVFLFCCMFLFSAARAQVWHSPTDESGRIFGQGWTSQIGTTFKRLPASAQSKVSSAVWSLSANAAGLNVRFVTNAKTITVSYSLTGSAYGYGNMAAILQGGVDLYAKDSKGKSHYVSCHKNFTFGTEIKYVYDHLNPQNLCGKDDAEYQLYFPMYCTLSSLKVGVPDGCTFTYKTVPADDSPIVVYGSSITQGCSASRPGNAWPSIVGRAFDANLINLGFSGSAMMENGMFDVLSELSNARLFIIDAIPNIKSAAGSIVTRTKYGVNKLRSVSKAPILLVESLGASDKVMNPAGYSVDANGNKKLREAYEELREDGVKNLFYMTEEEIGLTEDGMIEGVHPNDLGMKEYADAYINKINDILKNIEPDSTAEDTPLGKAVREGKRLLRSWVFGTNPGETPTEMSTKLQKLLTDAEAVLATGSCDAQCQGMADEINMQIADIKATRNALADGYYYIVSAYDGFRDVKGYDMAMYTQGTAVNWMKLDSTDGRFVYKLTKLADGNWSIQNCDTRGYINTSASLASLTMSESLKTEQILTEATDWSARFKISNKANAQYYVPNSNYFGEANGADVFNMPETYGSYVSTDPSNTAYGWQTWYIRRVTDESLLDSILKQMPTDATLALKEQADSAANLYARVLQPAADVSTKLIYEANDADPAHNQLSSNAKMPDEGTTNWGRYANLIDGNNATYFISKHNKKHGLPEGLHYLQVDLKDHPVDAFIFRYGRSSTWPTFSWVAVNVLATNDTTGGGKWTKITSLSNLPTSQSVTTFDSPGIFLWNSYRYIRFEVSATVNNLVIGGGPSFCLGEFQMFPVSIPDDAPYHAISGMAEAAEALQQQIRNAKTKIAANTATTSDIAALKAEMQKVNLLIGIDYTHELSLAVDTAVTLYNSITAPVADESRKLITEADDNDRAHNQFDSNAKMPDHNGQNWGRYAYLIDGNATTYFISKHMRSLGVPDVPHYLQVDLRKDSVESFIFRYGRSTVWPTFSWRDVDVYATNDTTSGTWEKVATLTGLNLDHSVASYDSPCIRMWNTYRYVRFSVTATEGNLMMGGGPSFCIGEFQIYPVKSADSAEYSTVNGMKASADALYEKIKESKIKIESKKATAGDVSALQDAVKAVLALRK